MREWSKVAVEVLEHWVSPVIGKDAIQEIKKPLLEEETKRSILQATERAEKRWLRIYNDQPIIDLVRQLPIYNLPIMQSAFEMIFENPDTPIPAEVFRNQLGAVLSKETESSRIESAVTEYFDILRVELIAIEAIRDKLKAIALIKTEKNTALTAKNTERTAIALEQIASILLGEYTSTGNRELFKPVEGEPLRTATYFLLRRAGKAPIPPFGVEVSPVILKFQGLAGANLDALNDAEKCILLASACLPHLLYERGMDFSQITERHVRDVVQQMEMDSSGSLQILTELAGELAKVASARNGFDSGSSDYGDVQFRDKRLRIRLLASLMHLSVALNLDEILDPSPPSGFYAMPWLQRYEWWQQVYVRGVSLDGQRVQLHYYLPRDRGVEYSRILVHPLSEELHRLIKEYDPVLWSAGININYIGPEVVETDIPAIPEEEWQLIVREVEKRQAYRIRNRLHQELMQTQKLSEIAILADIEYAEHLIAEERHQEAAEALSNIADLLANAFEPFQSTAYSSKAAAQFLAAGDHSGAAKQQIKTARTWLEKAKTPQRAQRYIEEAGKLIKNSDDPELRAALSLVRAIYEFAVISDRDSQQYLEQAKQIIPEISREDARNLILKEWAAHSFSFAMVREEWDRARESLQWAFRSFAENAIPEKLDVLIYLLEIHSAVGNWESADQVFERGQELLKQTPDPIRSGLLSIQYGVTLTRRSRLDEAYTVFAGALGILEGNSDAYTLAMAYQNMQFALLQNGALTYEGLDRDDVKRIDLFNRTVTQNRGYAHESEAADALGRGKPRDTLEHIRLALAAYWKDGSWHGVQEACKIVARLAEIDGNYQGALIAAIRGNDKDATRRYAEVLSEVAPSELLGQVTEQLSQTWTTASEQALCSTALSVLADVTPPASLERVLDHLLSLLQGPELNGIQIEVRRRSAEALQNLARQLNKAQTQRVIEISLQQIQRRQFWTVTDELLKIIQACLSETGHELGPPLYTHIGDVLYALNAPQPLDDRVRTTVVFLAHEANPEERVRAIQFLKQDTDRAEVLSNLAFLGETTPEDKLQETIDRILSGINPTPTIEEKEGKRTISIGIGAVNPRSLNNFKSALTPAQSEQIIDGLLEAIINENNHFINRTAAVATLSDFPTEALATRANEIADYLFWGVDGNTLPRSSLIDMELESVSNPFSNFRIDMGNVEMTQMASLRSLGRIYTFLDPFHQECVIQYLVSYARDENDSVRMGVAMALSEMENLDTLPISIVLTLIVLLHDTSPKVCAWACVATAQLEEQGVLGEVKSDAIERVIKLADHANTEIRIGATKALRRFLNDIKLSDSLRERILHVLDRLQNDRSFRVRSRATPD